MHCAQFLERQREDHKSRPCYQAGAARWQDPTTFRALEKQRLIGSSASSCRLALSSLLRTVLPIHINPGAQHPPAVSPLLRDLQLCLAVFNDFMTRTNDHENHQTPPGAWRGKMDMIKCQCLPITGFPLRQVANEVHLGDCVCNKIRGRFIHYTHTHTLVKLEIQSRENCLCTLTTKTHCRKRHGQKKKKIHFEIRLSEDMGRSLARN